MRSTKLLLLLFAVAATLVASGCGEAEKVTTPQAGSVPAGELTPEFIAALRTEIESEDDAPAPSTDAGLSASLGGVREITGPTVIQHPGYYRVTSDFAASEDGIVVRSDWVWLDLRHHTITGPGNKNGRGIVLDNVKHVLVVGGRLQTFGVGVDLQKTSWSCVRRVRVDGGDEVANPPAGIPPQIGVLLVNSYKNSVRGNEMAGVNLGIFVRGGGSFENRIRKNEVIGGDNGLLGICYNPASGEGPVGPKLDTVADNFLCGFGGGIQTSAESAYNRFRSNTIRYFTFAYEDFNGTNEFKNIVMVRITPGDGCDWDAGEGD